MRINSFIRENLSSAFTEAKRVYLAPDIPEKLLNNAVRGFGYDGDIANIVALYDNSMLGNGSRGLLLTGSRMLYRGTFPGPVVVRYDEMLDAVCRTDVRTGRRGTERRKFDVLVTSAGREPVVLRDFLACDYAALARFLKSVAEIGEYAEEDQLKAFSQMGEAFKIAYVMIVVEMAFSDDGVVDEREFSEILQLMTRLEMTVESRAAVRRRIAGADAPVSLAARMEALAAECPESRRKVVHVSLVKDLLNIFRSVSDAPLADFDFFNRNRPLFDVTDEEVELAEMAIENDRKMIGGEVSDSTIVKSVKELVAKSAAVGVPLGAVYLSGSVVGMSAAGLTSGLAAIGLGGVLGLSSMATGVGVAVLLGLGAYKGVRRLTGAGESEGDRLRKLLLQDVITQTQRAITDVVHDLNFMAERLDGLVREKRAMDGRVGDLLNMLQSMTKSSELLTRKSGAAERAALRLRCPAVLNVDRLRNLTGRPTQKPFYDLAVASYAASPVEGEEGRETVEYRLVADLPTRRLEALAGGFEAIGYFDAAKVVTGALGDGVGKAADRLLGVFS